MSKTMEKLPRRRFIVGLAALAWLGAACQRRYSARQPTPIPTRRGEMNGDQQFIGIVQNGHFQLLSPSRLAGIPTRLTRIPMQAAQSPDSAELELGAYEGKAIMVRGHSSGGWIYSAEVIDEAGPILTVVVQQVFGQKSAALQG